jgi:DNA recombination protein RmuC
LESSGLKEGREYFREMSLKSDDGRDFRPDFVIKLPANKHMVVDSKMSLNAYVNACSANTDEERKSYLREHVNAIRKHIKSLSEKCYEKLKGLNTPDYVFMFIGNEAAYLAAVEAEPKLFHEAYRKGVAVVTAGTLLSSLRIAAHLWSIDRQNSNTHLLAEQASKVYEKLRVFISKMDKLGVQLNTLQSSYDDSVRTLTSGKGSLQRQVNLFVDMGVSVKEEMPQLDIDIE